MRSHLRPVRSAGVLGLSCLIPLTAWAAGQAGKLIEEVTVTATRAESLAQADSASVGTVLAEQQQGCRRDQSTCWRKPRRRVQLTGRQRKCHRYRQNHGHVTHREQEATERREPALPLRIPAREPIDRSQVIRIEPVPYAEYEGESGRGRGADDHVGVFPVSVGGANHTARLAAG